MRLIDKLLREGKQNLSESEYFNFLSSVESCFSGDNMVRKDWKEFMVVGDIHGELEVSKFVVEKSVENDTPIVFLGDYVDRGEKQLENLTYLLSLKRENPDEVVLLRGNHETVNINRSYGFYDVVRSRYSKKLYDEIASIYDRLPVAGVVDDFYLAHGGIPEGIKEAQEIELFDKEDERYDEILWNDPSEDIHEFGINYYRGGYKVYGREAVRRFLKYNELTQMIRGHQCFLEGYRYFFDEMVLSLFSVPNYCGNKYGKYGRVSEGRVELVDISKKSL